MVLHLTAVFDTVNSSVLLFGLQFNFICIASVTMTIVSRHFTETQIMTPEQISLTKIIILNPIDENGGKKVPQREKKPLS